MNVRQVLMALRLVLCIPLVFILSNILASVVPLTSYLEGLGVSDPKLLLVVGVAILVAVVILNGESPGWLISLTYFTSMVYLIVASSPLIEVAFPTFYSNITELLENNVTLSTTSAFLYIPVLVIISIIDDYVGDLMEKETLLRGMGLPQDDIKGVVYPSMMVMAAAVLTSVLVFLWAMDYLVGRTIDFGQLYYLVPPVLLLALGISFSMGIFGRSEVVRTLLVIKAKVPVGERYSWEIEGDEVLLVRLTTHGGEVKEKEIRIDTEVKQPPERVVLHVEGPAPKRVHLRKLKESTDNGTRFVMYTNLWPREL